METDPESDSYIKNKTHYKNLITLTWDGNEEGHDVYVLPTDPNNAGYIKYIKILDTVPCSKEDASIVGVCRYLGDNAIEYNSSNISNPIKFMISSKY
jgi:hypothetical protein